MLLLNRQWNYRYSFVNPFHVRKFLNFIFHMIFQPTQNSLFDVSEGFFSCLHSILRMYPPLNASSRQYWLEVIHFFLLTSSLMISSHSEFPKTPIRERSFLQGTRRRTRKPSFRPLSTISALSFGPLSRWLFFLFINYNACLILKIAISFGCRTFSNTSETICNRWLLMPFLLQSVQSL